MLLQFLEYPKKSVILSSFHTQVRMTLLLVATLMHSALKLAILLHALTRTVGNVVSLSPQAQRKHS